MFLSVFGDPVVFPSQSCVWGSVCSNHEIFSKESLPKIKPFPSPFLEQSADPTARIWIPCNAHLLEIPPKPHPVEIPASPPKFLGCHYSLGRDLFVFPAWTVLFPLTPAYFCWVLDPPEESCSLTGIFTLQYPCFKSHSLFLENVPLLPLFSSQTFTPGCHTSGLALRGSKQVKCSLSLQECSAPSGNKAGSSPWNIHGTATGTPASCAGFFSLCVPEKKIRKEGK